MAKLFLKFEDQVIQEVPLSGGTVTIGRQPDNVLRIDNPAVSGYHAKVYSEGGHYVLEDDESFNGTYVNSQRISKVVLKDGDKALIGKHTIEFSDQQEVWHGSVSTVGGQAPGTKAKLPQLDRTAFLDTAKAKELISMAVAASSSGGSAAVQNQGISESQVPAAHVAHQTIGTLTIMEGRTDQNHYVLTSRLTVIGKSKMAGIRLKRWFAPHVAASIYRSEDGYYIAASGDKVKVKVNDVVVEGGKKQLEAGNVIEVDGIKAVFGFCEA
ncbi:MAG TPA: FHA domain-containing protein [Candidatus Sulfotelmatobacter sp.]|nr:FHA domain-containing protein [Candidatus Sulfotelmatobacter sp.]